jgi:hypothetical protein
VSRGSGLRDNGDVERVRDASDIVSVVGKYLALHAKGREFVALCPFHDDRKPSMTVSPGKQIYKCFACGAGGDVFSFVQQYHGMDFGEALRHLAEEAGIELTPRARPETGFGGGPVGLNSLAVAVGEDAATLEEVHEPYLIMQGYIKRTAQGRVAMPKAYRKIGLEPPAAASAPQPDLFGK